MTESVQTLSVSVWSKVIATWHRSLKKWVVVAVGEPVCSIVPPGSIDWIFTEAISAPPDPAATCAYERWVLCGADGNDACPDAETAGPDLTPPAEQFLCRPRKWVSWNARLVDETWETHGCEVVVSDLPPGPTFWIRTDRGAVDTYEKWVDGGEVEKRAPLCPQCGSGGSCDCAKPPEELEGGSPATEFDGTEGTLWFQIVAIFDRVRGFWSGEAIAVACATVEEPPGEVTWQAIEVNARRKRYAIWANTGVPAEPGVDAHLIKQDDRACGLAQSLVPGPTVCGHCRDHGADKETDVDDGDLFFCDPALLPHNAYRATPPNCPAEPD